jgi:ferritin
MQKTFSAKEIAALIKRAQDKTNPTASTEVKKEESKGVEQTPDTAPGEQVKLKVDERQTKFLTKEMNDMLNEQIAFEMFSAYVYYMIAAWSQTKGLTGFEKHFKVQGAGEIGHAMKIYEYLVTTGSTVDLPIIPSPTNLIKFSNMQEACRAVLDHEMLVTRRWQAIGERAKADPNLATQELAQWFMTEQVEEEDTAMTMLNKVELADSGSGLLIIDAGLK